MDKVVHFEIPFDDGDRARKFYADARKLELAVAGLLKSKRAA